MQRLTTTVCQYELLNFEHADKYIASVPYLAMWTPPYVIKTYYNAADQTCLASCLL